MKRLLVYFIYNKYGWIGDYEIYYLDEMRKFCNEICVVVNEPLSSDGRIKLKDHCDKLLVRENFGFDSSAYKHAILHYGFETIAKNYDQLILSNFTFYGPIFPIEEFFNKMDSSSADFYGITKHPSMDDYLLSKYKIVEHIQSFFVALNKNILSDQSFKDYWNKLQVASNYEEAIAFHELKFSNYFEKKGFKLDTFVDFEKYKDYRNNSTILEADKIHIIDRCPFVKRKVFFWELSGWIDQSTNHISKDVYDYIEQQSDYPISLIWEDLLKNQKLSDLKYLLHLSYPNSTKKLTKDCNTTPSSSLALILFVYYDDQVSYCLKYACSMPQNSSIFIVATNDDILSKYQEILKLNDLQKKYIIYFRKMENRGRDVGAYLVCCSDVFDNYKYVCCMHDKKTKQLNNNLMSEEFAYFCFENNLASETYVKNVVSTFDTNPHLGMLVPPTLNFGQFYPILGRELTCNAQNMQILFDKLKLEIPFDDHPVAPYGTMFWVRAKAFKSMFNYKWSYKDFPIEPLKSIDGSILNAIERIYPSAVQNSGYYVGWLFTEQFLSSYVDTNTYMLREINSILPANASISPRFMIHYTKEMVNNNLISAQTNGSQQSIDELNNKCICQQAHIDQLILSERELQAKCKCQEGHVEQLLQSERDLKNQIEQLKKTKKK